MVLPFPRTGQTYRGRCAVCQRRHERVINGKATSFWELARDAKNAIATVANCDGVAVLFATIGEIVGNGAETSTAEEFIRAVCDRLSGRGFIALAPAIFDRKERDFESGYSDAERARAVAFLSDFDWSAALLDTEAAVDELRATAAPAVPASLSWRYSR